MELHLLEDSHPSQIVFDQDSDFDDNRVDYVHQDEGLSQAAPENGSESDRPQPDVAPITLESLDFKDHTDELVSRLKEEKDRLISLYNNYSERLGATEDFYDREVVLKRYLESIFEDSNNQILGLLSEKDGLDLEQIESSISVEVKRRNLALNFFGIYTRSLKDGGGLKIDIVDHPEIVDNQQESPASQSSQISLSGDALSRLEAETRDRILTQNNQSSSWNRDKVDQAEGEQILKMVTQEIAFNLLTTNFRALATKCDQIEDQIKRCDRIIENIGDLNVGNIRQNLPQTIVNSKVDRLLKVDRVI